MRILAAATLIVATLSAALAQQPAAKLTLYKTVSSAACADDQTVWLDPGSQLYYVKGEKLYGKTPRGGYNCRRQADAAGYHPSGAHGASAR